MFPSPCGVNIVANTQQILLPSIRVVYKFPSPCGVNIVANKVSVDSIHTDNVKKVSVPLRGKYRGEYTLN